MKNIYFFTEISIQNIDIAEFNAVAQKSIFTTVPWINFILEDNLGAIPIILRITKNQHYIGYFTGALIKKFGITIIGSPFRGWSTCFMGFDLENSEDRLVLLNELKIFLFSKYKCQYFEFIDRSIPLEPAVLKFSAKTVETLELSVNKTDEELFKVFKADCRNFIRQFERRGAKIEIAKPDDDFAEEFYLQLKDVFAKQNMKPTYRVEKVKRLIRNLAPYDMVLCLRVRDPNGDSIATSIFPGYKNKFFFWGGASYRITQSYRPNEYMIWTAIKYWRDHGVCVFDMMGVRDYKKKFGSSIVKYPVLEFACPKMLIWAKDSAERFYLRSLNYKH